MGSLNTQIPVSTEKKKNCANMRQFKNATISCDGRTNAEKKKTNSHNFSNSYDFSKTARSKMPSHNVKDLSFQKSFCNIDNMFYASSLVSIAYFLMLRQTFPLF